MKKCSRCKIEKENNNFGIDKHMRCGLNSWCNKCKSEYAKEMWHKKPEEYRERQRKYNFNRRQKILNAYGNKCTCCGEDTPEFLELDHKNKDGTKHRKQLGTLNIYPNVIKEGYPKDKYQLLCANCNHSLGSKGYCPHQIKNDLDIEMGNMVIRNRFTKKLFNLV